MDLMKCPNCNNEIYSNEVFCPFCGVNLGSGADAAPQQTGSNNMQYFNVPQSPQPQPPQYCQSARQAAPAKNNSRVLVGIIAFLSVLLFSSAFVLFIKPGYMLKKSGSEQSDGAGAVTMEAAVSGKAPANEDKNVYMNDTKPQLSVSPVSGSSSDEPATSHTAVTTKKPVETTKKTTTTKEAATKKTTTTTAETSPPQTDPGVNSSAYDEAMSYSTSERPTFEDFLWCIGQYGLVTSPPYEYAELISDPLGFSGGWKSMMIFDTSNPTTREFDNVYIDIYDRSVALTIDWYMIETDNSERSYMEDSDDMVFVGTLEMNGAGVFTVTGMNCDITMVYFWKQDGKEYALGQVQPNDGMPWYIALVR